ncbi:MAG: tRNA (adenosine(37)-N6)-dimethylallyltransferase MiaA [Oscillospiraceae bacterium]|nr:tRNA (adenosine(37)-N6)-dimethylallyltransferase MiaA [Oscillospiraceae bacterium]
MPPLVIVITGPTATGKTAVGAGLALAVDGEVVSADSMQVYRMMSIGTAKPTPEETRGVPHHMIDCASPFEPYSAARYVAEASACCEDILSRGKVPVIVGGTGLYIDALLAGREFAREGDPVLREALGREYDESGGEAMLARLAAADPETAARLHPNDRKRIVRALEVHALTGATLAEHNRASRLVPPRYESLRFALTFARRQDLYDRIDRRVDRMMAEGLAGEVRSLLAQGLTASHTAMQAIGYKELAAAVSAGIPAEQAAEDIKRESRRYAKRQLSWLRRDEGLHWIVWDREPDPDAAVRQIAGVYHQFTGKEPPCKEATH